MPRVETFSREEVIRKSMEVFHTKGYNGTSIQDLVEATGLNRSSIYNSFGSKQDLYRVALSYYEEENTKVFRKALLRSSNAMEALERILNSAVSSVLEDREGKGCFILNCKSELGNTDEYLREWLNNNQEKSISLFTEIVAEGQKEGTINKQHNPTRYGYSLFNTFQGLRMTGILTRDKDVLEGIISNAIEQLQ